MGFSHWIDTVNNDFNRVINNIDNYREWFQIERDPLTNRPLNYMITKHFLEDEILELQNTNIRFNAYSFSYETPRAAEEENEDRVRRIKNNECFVIIYSTGDTVHYIINRISSTAKTLLRKLNNYEGRGEIEVRHYPYGDDLADWLVYIARERNNDVLDDNSSLRIRGIIGFKGPTNVDRLSEISGSGDFIMDALGTLGFLLESEEFKYLKPKISYRRHNIDLSLLKNKSIDIDFESYAGSYMFIEGMINENAEVDIALKTRLLLHVTEELVGHLVDVYNRHVENGQWSTQVKIQTLRNIGHTINTRVTEKIEDIEANELEANGLNE